MFYHVRVSHKHNTVFGWMDFRRCGKWGRKMGFPLFGNGRKIGGVKNPGEKFLSRAHKFFPPKSGGKARGENCTEAVLL